MNFRILLYLFVIVYWSSVVSAEKFTSTDKRILKNWVAAQTGEFVGYAITGFTLRILDESSIINFASNEERNKMYIISGAIMGSLGCNYFLKNKTNQSFKTFSKNLLFSSIPTALYLITFKPKFEAKTPFWEKYQGEFGIVLVSMFLTPIFSTFGNEIFGTTSTPVSEEMGLTMHPKFLKIKDGYLLSISLRF